MLRLAMLAPVPASLSLPLPLAAKVWRILPPPPLEPLKENTGDGEDSAGVILYLGDWLVARLGAGKVM